MEFNERLIHPLPFYMTHPGYLGPAQQGAALQDLEYLQQTYPQEVKYYQRKIAEILDKLDYEGSMIYDEYPDRYSLRRLTGSIVQVLKHEEKEKGAQDSELEEKWSWQENMIQVLLCNEIYKRRHGGRRSLFTI